jgi:hypothetical protein
MDHEYCKQHPRPMPAPVMAAIRVRREPKMADLSVSLSRSAPEASAEKNAVVNFGDNAMADSHETRGRCGLTRKRE